MTTSSTSSTSGSTSSLPPLPDGIMRLSDYQAQQKAAALTANTQMGEGAFMTLFTAQLQNQDPTDPVKNDAFVSQLAQFSQLEATTSMQTSLQTMVNNQQQSTMSTASSLIGKSVGISNGAAVLSNGNPVNAIVNLPAGADGLQIQVVDSTGAVVKTMTYGSQLPGPMDVNWDGSTDAGGTAPDGTYTFNITGTSGGKNITPSWSTMATITSATTATDGSNAWLLGYGSGKTVPLTSVQQISD
jgi:flagellar basal-body rod modification protein FlgD